MLFFYPLATIPSLKKGYWNLSLLFYWNLLPAYRNWIKRWGGGTCQKYTCRFHTPLNQKEHGLWGSMWSCINRGSGYKDKRYLWTTYIHVHTHTHTFLSFFLSFRLSLIIINKQRTTLVNTININDNNLSDPSITYNAALFCCRLLDKETAHGQNITINTKWITTTNNHRAKIIPHGTPSPKYANRNHTIRFVGVILNNKTMFSRLAQQ